MKTLEQIAVDAKEMVMSECYGGVDLAISITSKKVAVTDVNRELTPFDILGFEKVVELMQIENGTMWCDGVLLEDTLDELINKES